MDYCNASMFICNRRSINSHDNDDNDDDKSKYFGTTRKKQSYFVSYRIYSP